ncbi:MAG TPA: bifunctional riboflavin kinase/FAD synthetase [Acidimicrobiales bacterium]|jgi:riboflavin kinase/FMN adenylyltransferase|nr:bifunctional riboflavin kinase/FAD synthetase [Acidimicrobiales bacterium]
MQILHDGEGPVDSSIDGTAVTIGVFDGVHVGHQYVLRELRKEAAAKGLRSAVVTFDTHPALVLRPENAPKLLNTLEQKLELLEENGVDATYVVHFDEARSRTEPDEFVREVFVESLRARALVVGEDFHFGRGRSGNVDRLRELGDRIGFEVRGLELIRHDPHAAEPVTSTAVRRALAGGDVAAAAAMLGRPYEVRGTVQRGDERGRTIGFPTANIPVSKQMAWPADAVYAGWYRRPDGAVHPCAINIGRRPTFYEHAQQSLLEAHLLDFEGDLYGEEARVTFIEFLRSEHRFSGIDALGAQLKKDIEHARAILGV